MLEALDLAVVDECDRLGVVGARREIDDPVHREGHAQPIPLALVDDRRPTLEALAQVGEVELRGGELRLGLGECPLGIGEPAAHVGEVLGDADQVGLDLVELRRSRR